MSAVTNSNMTGKLEGVEAYNTNTKSNKFCALMHERKATICGVCYSHKMLDTFRKNCIPKFERNSQAFAEDIPAHLLPTTRGALVRLNAHGELINASHLYNIHKLATKNPHSTFALWTKRVGLVREYLKQNDKPKNLIFVYSNPTIDKPIDPPRGFDKAFNNVTKQSGIKQNCTGKKCIDCRVCYTVGSKPVRIVEAVK